VDIQQSALAVRFVECLGEGGYITIPFLQYGDLRDIRAVRKLADRRSRPAPLHRPYLAGFCWIFVSIAGRQGYNLTLAIRGNHHYRPGRCVKSTRSTSP
jgi:hypothetical protein